MRIQSQGMIGKALFKILDTFFCHLLVSTFPRCMHTNFSTSGMLCVYFVNNVAVFPLRTICFLFIRFGFNSVRELRTGNKSDLFYKNVNKLDHSVETLCIP